MHAQQTPDVSGDQVQLGSLLLPTPVINMCFVGPVGTGKSTIMARVLYLCGGIDRRTIEHWERESANQGFRRYPVSYFTSWILDRHHDERERGY